MARLQSGARLAPRRRYTRRGSERGSGGEPAAWYVERLCGVGPIVAAKVLGETRGIDRLPTAATFAAHAGTAPVPASSGHTRHRPNRGGLRQLNRALFTIAMVHARWHPAARAYLERKRAEGKGAAEARRCLKRHLAKTVYRTMRDDALDAQTRTAS